MSFFLTFTLSSVDVFLFYISGQFSDFVFCYLPLAQHVFSDISGHYDLKGSHVYCDELKHESKVKIYL